MPHSISNASSLGKLEFKTFNNTINGKLSSTKVTRHGINPSTEKPNPEVPVATEEDVKITTRAARAAFPAWAASPIEDRRKALKAWAAAFLELKDEFANLLTLEQGRPVSLYR